MLPYTNQNSVVESNASMATLTEVAAQTYVMLVIKFYIYLDLKSSQIDVLKRYKY